MLRRVGFIVEGGTMRALSVDEGPQRGRIVERRLAGASLGKSLEPLPGTIVDPTVCPVCYARFPSASRRDNHKFQAHS